MDINKKYINYNPELLMNSLYLTEKMAFFLGGIFAAEEKVNTPQGSYRVAPVRYNYNAATKLEIAQHYEIVKEIAEEVNGQTVMADNIRNTVLDSGKNRMPGFSTFFKMTTDRELVELIPLLRVALKNSDWVVRRAFLVGVFDGRASADIDKKTHKIRMLSLDCISEDVGSFLSEMVEYCEIRYNYNTHRDRLEGGKPRNPQLRIRDVDDYIKRIGLISPRKINLLREAYRQNYSNVNVIDNSDVLKGLKTIEVR